MPDTASLQLAWLADRFRAQAALGLHYRPDDADRARFHQLRRHAAELLACVDSRDVDLIEATFSKDDGLSTPLAAIAFWVTSADDVHLRRVAYLPPNQPLPHALTKAATRLQADTTPTRPVALVDSHELGLPDPHTHIAVYRVDSTLQASAIVEAWPEPATALQRALGQYQLDETRGPRVDAGTDPVPVNAEAKAICDRIAELAASGQEHSSDRYNVERFAQLRALAENTVVEDITYQPFESYELNPDGATTGAEVAIFDTNNRMLLVQRADTGQWAIPGGGCEVGESWAATAAREVREEIGLRIEDAIDGLVGVVDNRVITSEPTTIPVIAIFQATLRTSDLDFTLSSEIRDVAWVTEEQLSRLDLFAGHRAKITAAFGYRSNAGRRPRDAAAAVSHG